MPASPDSADQRIWRLYSPLALSWLFMAMESPISVAVLGRMADSEVHTAAFFTLMSVSIFIECPVIDLLSTSTALATTWTRFVKIRRFALMVMGVSTLGHVLMAATPLFDFVMGPVLHLPPEVRDVLRTPMWIMMPWSAAIGWRRYLQGTLIRAGMSKPISIGTAVRVSTVVVVSFLLGTGTRLPGIEVVAWALVASVVAECAFIAYAARRAIPIAFPMAAREEDDDDLRLRHIAKFHAPLSGATMMQLCTGSLIAGAFGRLPGTVEQSAAWQVQSSLLWLARTVTFALPEVVIRMAHEERSDVLKRFCGRVGLVCTGVLLLFAATGADLVVMERLLHVDPRIRELAHKVLIMAALLPWMSAVMNYAKGMLTAHHATISRLYAIIAGTTTLVAALAIGVAARAEGVVVAVASLMASTTAEWIVLVVAWRRWTAKRAIAQT